MWNHARPSRCSWSWPEIERPLCYLVDNPGKPCALESHRERRRGQWGVFTRIFLFTGEGCIRPMKKLDSKIGFSIMFLVLSLYSISMILAARGEYDPSENILNRVILITIIFVGLFKLRRMAFYYLKHILILDFILFSFVIAYVYGVESFDILSMSPLVRLVVFFYAVPYLMRRLTVTRIRLNIVMGMLIIVALMSYMSIKMVNADRLNFGGSGTDAAEFYLSISYIGLAIYLFCGNKKNLHCVQFIAVIVVFSVLPLVIFTGSRQGVIGVIFLLAISTLAKLNMKEVLSAKTVAILLVLPFMALFLNYFSTRFDIQRLFSTGSPGRLARYQYFIDALENGMWQGFFFRGMDMPHDKFLYDSVWIDSALHNVYLVYAAQVGILSAALICIFHLVCFRIVVKLYKNGYSSPVFNASVAMAALAYFIGQIENYLFFVSSLLAYIFYILLGLFVNIYRNRKKDARRCRAIAIHGRPDACVNACNQPVVNIVAG